MKIGKIYISCGFAVFFSICYFFDDSGYLWAVTLSAAVHELGHWTAVRMLGGEVYSIRLGYAGAAISYSEDKMSYLADAAIAAAGPAASLVLALAVATAGSLLENRNFFYIAGTSLIFFIFNIMPVYQLDGGRIVYSAAARFKGVEFAGKLTHIFSCAVIFALLLAGTLLAAVTKRNVSLITAALWLLITYCKKGENTVK